MQAFFKVLFIFLLMLVVGAKTNAITFDEAFNVSDKKPMLVLIYAPWADNAQSFLQNFRMLPKEFGDKFNYVELNIATVDAKSFNQRYHIYPNLPYVLMFRNGGKISRYIPKNCASSASCMIPKIKSFIQ